MLTPSFGERKVLKVNKGNWAQKELEKVPKKILKRLVIMPWRGNLVRACVVIVQMFVSIGNTIQQEKISHRKISFEVICISVSVQRR